MKIKTESNKITFVTNISAKELDHVEGYDEFIGKLESVGIEFVLVSTNEYEEKIGKEDRDKLQTERITAIRESVKFEGFSKELHGKLVRTTNISIVSFVINLILILILLFK